MELKQRIRRGLAAHGIKPVDVARQLGVTKTSIYNVISEKIKSDRILEHLATTINCSVEWLKFGTGQRPSWAPPQPGEVTVYPSPPTVESTANQPTTRTVSQPMALPLAGTATAGGGWAHGEVDESESINIKGGLVAIRIEGDSAEPLVQDGQCVIADPSISLSDLVDNTIVVVQTAIGEVYCKRFSGNVGGKLFLSSINQGRDSVIIDAEGCVISKVVGVLF